MSELTLSRPGAATRPRRRASTAPARWASTAGIALMCLSGVLPLVFMGFTAFRTERDWDANKIGLPTTWSTGAFERAWHGASIGLYFRNSTIVTLGTIALTVLCASLAGFSFSKIRWRMRGIAYFFVLAWIAIPPLLMMVPIYVWIVQLGLKNTYWSMVLLYTAFNLPFNVYLMAAFFRALPDELLEAGTIDGASIHPVFFQILLPLAGPAGGAPCLFH